MAGVETFALLNAYSSQNLGDAAIMMALASLSRSLSRKAEVLVDLPKQAEFTTKGVRFEKPSKSCDRFISVGGDIFNNARPWAITRAFMRNVAQLRTNPKRTIIFGQTIPASCHGAALWWLCRVMNELKAVVVRDEESWKLLRERGVNAELSFDSAFALTISDDDKARARLLFEAAGLAPERTVLLSVRGFDGMYPQDSERFIARMAETARLISRNGYAPAVLVQSQVKGGDGDRCIVDALRRLAPETAVLDALTDADPDPVRRLIGAFALAIGVVAVRYHAAVLALAAGRQVYHLPYSRKGEDLSRRLNLPGAPLAAFDPESAARGVLDLADQTFDAKPIAADVRAAFSNAWAER